MDKEQSLALLAQGQDAWNAWAKERLAERAALEQAGEWAAARSRGRLEGQNDKTKAWLAEAAVDFSGHTFEQVADFSGCVFPGDTSFRGATLPGFAEFEGATFSGDAEFDKATFWVDARFGGATFSGDAGFAEATISGDARFGEVVFSGNAGFGGATFSVDAKFGNAKFSGDAAFGGATFSGDARFGGATFSGYAVFEGATFSGYAGFREATFSGYAGFGQCTFEGYATFANARLRGEADFSAILAKRAFTIAGADFHRVPDFIQASFAEAPRLDNVRVRLSSSMKRLLGGNPDIPARWRALKRLAIEGHDNDREQQFFAMEIRSARFSTDWPLHWRFWDREAMGGVFRFWTGMAYQLVSNFGRSLIRPLAAWSLVMLLGATFFLGQHPDVRASGLLPTWQAAKAAYDRRQPCVPGLKGPATDAPTEAWHLAFRNAFIILDGGGDAAFRSFGCLYGISDYGGQPIPNVPSPVAWASVVQKALSGIFIFLFGLALRNMLKMK